MIEWNEYDENIRNFGSITSFKRTILEFMRTSEISVFLCKNPKGIQLLAILRLGLSHLRQHKFKHNFQDTFNLISNCSKDIEISCQYLLHCSLYTNERLGLLNVIRDIDNKILELNDLQIVKFSFMEKNYLTC